MLYLPLGAGRGGGQSRKMSPTLSLVTGASATLSHAIDQLESAGLAGRATLLPAGEGLFGCEYIPAGDVSADRDHVAALLAPFAVDWALRRGAKRRARLLVADMDSTVISVECLDELADYAGKKAEIAAITEEAMQGRLEFGQALHARVAMLAGLDESALETCFSERVRLNPGARVLVHTMAAHGAHCALVSGGFTFFTQRVAALAGFHSHRGNLLGISGGRLTGAVEGPILGRAAKSEALGELSLQFSIDPVDIMAIGDGANDADMVAAAGLGIAFYAKPALEQVANARIRHTDLRAALFFQGYRPEDFVTG